VAVSGAGIRLDWRAVARGTLAYLIVAVPCAVLIAVTHGHDNTGQESNLWVVAAVLVIFVAPLVGGAVAATAKPRAPLSHGAAAVGLPAGAYLLVRMVVGAVNGSLTGGQAASFVLFLMVFTGIAVIGAYLAFRRHARA
jgi:hypothetical protein